MKVEQLTWTERTGWKTTFGDKSVEPQIVFVFGDNASLFKSDALGWLRSRYHNAHFFGGTAAYEISQAGFCENSVVATAVEFKNVSFQLAKASLADRPADVVARNLVAQFSDRENISHVLVLCDGLHINGTRFVNAVTELLPDVPVTGGMTAAADVKEPTVEILDDESLSRYAIALAFGKGVKTGYGSGGGWDAFGIDRIITRSDGNRVYEIDGEPALALYKKYLGEEGENLSYDVQYFPLFLKETQDAAGRVRSVISIDEAENSLIFAADMPQGWHVRLMKYNSGRLAEGAAGAAGKSLAGIDPGKPFLAFLVSCVGRQVVLRKRVVDEIDASVRVLGGNQYMMGFYSRGEICPLDRRSCPVYHNQTMTVTTISDE